ncbi:MAG: alpha/beta fold hydrolase [Woeseiaceae bacterium]
MNANLSLPTQVADFIRNRRSRNLFLQATIPATSASIAAVFCAPFSEERQKSYRVHYRLAQFLAERGITCFRFDYLGSGDSDGNSIEASIDTMVEDTCDVVAHARALHEADHLYLVGTRLGATIAALAAERSRDLAGIALLFPVIDGRRYWEELVRQQQVEVLAASLRPMSRSEVERQLEERGYVELESNRISREMAVKLRNLDLRRVPAAFRGRVLSVSLEGDHPLRDGTSEVLANYEKCGCRTEQSNDEALDCWTPRSMYDGYVPSNTFKRVSGWLQS